MKTILQTQNLCKDFINGTKVQQVLKDINISIEENEYVSIMGSSGSGKSTLLYTMSGMDKASAGDSFLNGSNITKMSEEDIAKLRLHEMGFIFQQSHLLKNLNVEDNILLPAYKAGKVSYDELIKRVNMLMEKMGVSDLASHKIHEASGGQLQRIGICRALINKPAIIFGDEPTGALNLSSTLEILDIFDRLHKDGVTIVLVTHDIRVAARSERVLFMVDGQIIDSLTLGTYNAKANDFKEREIQLSTWLATHQF